MTSAPARLVVLISGSGSNLQALIDATAQDRYPARVVGVISNKADAYGLERAAQAGITTAVVDHKQFAEREAFDAALAEQINRLQPDLVVLAGFMRILSAAFVQGYLGRLINIHPSLLPEFPGLHTHARVLQAGASRHGASVHFVTPELDAGPVIVQGSLRVLPEDSAESLAARVLAIEHRIYPLAVAWLASGKASYHHPVAVFGGEPLPPQGYQIAYDD